MRRLPSPLRLALAAALTLAATAAAGAQELRGRAPAAGAAPASAAPSTNARSPGAVGAAARDPGARPGSPPTSIFGDRGARPRPAATAYGLEPAVPLALAGLRGGGDAAPVCRAACAASFYQCASGGGAEGCQAAADVCRARCDISTLPPVGRLTSPLPLAGVAGAGSLRGLPGAPSGRLGQQ